MATNDLYDYMRSATAELQAEYERIQKRAAEDPGTAGDNGEENWAALLREWLPATYRIVTKGRIMNTKGDCGPQVDVLVLSPSYSKALLDRNEYLEGGVLAAFECKLTLKAEHIKDAIDNAATIRRLSLPVQTGTPYKELVPRVRYGLLAHSHVWKGETSTPIENIERHLHAAERNGVQHPKESLDIICVSNLATWTTLKAMIGRWMKSADGVDALSALQIRYEHMGGLWEAIQQAGGVIDMAHSCFSEIYQTTDEKKRLFTPIGSFLASLLKMFAWEDKSRRSLADYFILADLLGSGQGTGKAWSLSVLTEDLTSKLRQGVWLGTRQKWDEWSFAF